MIRLLFAAILGLMALAAPGGAATLTYTIDGRGSGSLDGAAFQDAAFRFTLRGDTANFQRDEWTNGVDPLDSARIRIAGIGSLAFQIPTRIGYSRTHSAVFFSRAGASRLDLFDFTVAQPVDLGRSFAAILGTGVYALNQFQGVATSGGALSFDASSSVTLTAVPLPAAGWLLLAGLGALAALRGQAPKTRAKIVSTCLV